MLVKLQHCQHSSWELIAHSWSILAVVTRDFAKGIKTNPYAPRTGHDDRQLKHGQTFASVIHADMSVYN